MESDLYQQLIKKFDNETNVSEFGAEISVNKGLKVHSNESHEK